MNPVRPLRLYRHPLSGHSHRAELALSFLGLRYVAVDVDLMRGAHKQPDFIAMNPFGQVPVLDDDGTIVSDSNAILVYLATRHDPARRWLPLAPKAQADVQVWLSVAAGQIAFGPAAARLITVFGAKRDAAEAIGRAHAVLEIMDVHLRRRLFLTGDAATLADIACYSYVAAAPEGNVDLAGYAHVRQWLGRIEDLPGFVPFQRTAVGLVT